MGSWTAVGNVNPSTALVTPITGTVETKVAAGDVFLSGTGEMTLSVAGNVRMLLSNPAGATKQLYLYKLDVFASAIGYAELFVNPTVVPTVARRVNNVNFGSGVTAFGVIYADTNTTTALSGGIDSGISVGAAPNILTVYNLPPIVIPPGVSLGLQLPFTGAATATVNAFWWEA